MRDPSIVIFAEKPSEGRTIYETIDIYIPKTNHSNAPTVGKVFANLEHSLYTKSSTWRTPHTNVRLAASLSIRGLTSKPTY